MSKYDESKDKGIIVDNTNTTAMEIAPYARLAEVFGVPFVIRNFYCDVPTACSRGVHSVPYNTLVAMQKNLTYDLLPPYWPQVWVVQWNCRTLLFEDYETG